MLFIPNYVGIIEASLSCSHVCNYTTETDDSAKQTILKGYHYPVDLVQRITRAMKNRSSYMRIYKFLAAVYVLRSQLPYCVALLSDVPNMCFRCNCVLYTYLHMYYICITVLLGYYFSVITVLLGYCFFTAWLFWIRFHFFLYLYTPKPAYGQLWDFFNLCFFLYYSKKKR